MTFAHGVEARCPFLDPDLFDLSKTLPQSFKLSSQGVEKSILKTAYKDSLPKFVLESQNNLIGLQMQNFFRKWHRLSRFSVIRS